MGGGQERNGTASVDPSTMNDWATLVGVDGSSGLGANTSSIGRIWTDKTVSADSVTTSDGNVVKCDNSAFVTVLSALSGTSNVASTSTTPLDIVLVLDASGSMDDNMSDGTKRIDALKSAANGFIGEIADQNKGISDESKQHQVSIVKFAGNKTAAVGNDTYRSGGYTYNYSQVMKTMSPCNNTTQSVFTDTIDSINPAGATAADNGLQLAQGQTSNREEAKKIVIFFTDGSPTDYSDFDDSVAGSAVSAAKDMKDAGATVYTVGIFDGVNPSADPTANNTTKENKFMHAVSSNYPKATYTESGGWWSSWNWDFGDRPEGSNYYKSASNADELKQVFDGIFSEINKGSGYPTQTTEGAEHQSGYITFDDKLGSYMQVDNFSAVTFSGKTFTNPQKTTEGNVDTYTFNGTVELNGKSVDLSNLVIKVARSNNLAEGDTIQAKIPAALIPLWNFNVNRDDMTMTVSEQKPIDIVYTSSLKPGVEDLLANPDETMEAYLQANSADGKVAFYNNDWNPGYLGSTTAGFEPSSDNSFYYFTKDTPIYTDEACTQRATRIDEGTTYWYQHTYYKMKNAGSLSGAVEEVTQPISFKGSDAESLEGSIGSDGSGAYFKAGSREATFINSLYKEKDKNVTETAEDVLNPKWASVGQIASYLGNNGKLSVDLPGALAVTKQLQVPDGYSADEFASESFEFTVAVPEAANKAFNAVVKNANGEQQGDAFTLTFDGDGKAQHSLKADETLCIYGLTAGWNYTVGETERSGFDQSGTNLEGAIAAGETAQAKVVNTYKASGTLSGEQVLKGEKVLTGRSWKSTDKFTFLLEAPEGSVDVPMPGGAGRATVEVTQPDGAPADTPVSFNFGDITYTKPGVYTYEIRESKELSVFNPGVSASKALYEVVVTVTDEGHNGTLTVTSALTKKYDDDGVKLDNPEGATVAKFVNEYDTQVVKWSPSGGKLYTDATGSRPLEAGMFHVIACTNDPNAPLPQLQGEQKIEDERNGVKWYGAVTSVEADGTILFPQATFTFDNLGTGQSEKTFTYKIIEVVKVGDKWRSVEDALADPNFDSAGVTYDPTIWTVEVTLKNDNGTLVLDTKYSNNLLAAAPGEGNTPMFRFSNSYAPAAATAVVKGSKTLTGRDMADGETFGFELSAADDATQSAVASGAVTLPGAATVSGAKDGVATGFAFDGMSFTKPGEYTFNVNETTWKGEAVPATDEKGMQFDRSTKTVKVKVTDDHTGSLKAEVVNPQDEVAFTNKYATSSTYNGIQVEKTLTGRDMKAGEFNFVIEGKDDASAALLADSDKQFTNPNNRAEGIADVMTKIAGHTFTQADSGKHFEFTVKEVIPEGAVQDQATGLWYVEATGLYYDGANHVVTIDVADDGNGQLTTTTKVDGQETNVVSFANKYRAQNVSFDTATAHLNKILQGRDWIENDSFDFTITARNGAPMPKRDGNEVSSATVKSPNSKDGDSISFDFGQIEFTSDMVEDAPGHKRTFTYEVTENPGNPPLPGIQYSDNRAIIEVTVSDNGQGKLVASATTQNGTFVNRYSSELNYSAAGGLNLAKTLTGRDMTDGQFIIKITPNDEASAGLLGLPEGGREVSMPAANDGVQVTKSALTGDVVLTQRDAGKTYSYKVVEQGTAPSGYTYDTAERTVTITVESDPVNGTLKATTVVSGGPDGTKTYVYSSNAVGTQEKAVVPFNNSYAASGEVGVTATKSLTGRNLTEGEFNFAVKYASGGDDLLTASNKADGSIDFGKLSYTTETLANLAADGYASKDVKDGKPAWNISYRAYEKTDSLPRGVSVQTELISFTVTVVDNGDGTLTATANTGNGLKFQNVYSTGGPVSVGLSGVKDLKSDAGLTPASIEGKFTFTVTSDDAAAPMPEHTTATNDANGNVDFGNIKFTLDDLNKALGTNSTHAADTAGQNASDQGSAAGADSEEQGNAAASDGAEQGQGAAVVTGEGTGAASVSTAANKVAGAEDADQASAQSDEPATRAGVVRSHTFTYKVTESGSADGVTNDTETKTVSFKVTDDGNGKLTVERLGAASDPAFTFTNTYSVQPVDSSVTDQVTVTKNLTGRDMKAGEFEFQLLDGTKVVATGTNDASGNVALSPITYTKPGTYNYTLCEVGGGSQKAGVQYDGSTFAVTTTVTDNGDGTLSVAHKVDNDANAVGFTNSYTPAATSVTLGASKVLNGKSLDAEEFTFVLTDEGGEQVTATNDANGMVVFPAIQYGEAGKYQYTIAEVKGDESDVTYDESKYAVTVTVEDNGEGSLVATVAYEGGNAPVFTNTYNAPEGPASPGDGPASIVKDLVSGSAKTGDYLLVIAGVAAAVAAAAAAVAVVSRRKKGKHAKR